MTAFDAANARLRRIAQNSPVDPTKGREFKAALEQIKDRTRPAMLENIKLLSMSRGMTPRSLSLLTGIPKARIQKLSNHTEMEEPWLDEAYLLHRVLCTPGIVPLMSGSGKLSECSMGVFFASDVDAFRAGRRLPLSVACRLAVRFGLDDPAELVARALHIQIWDVVSSNERGAEPGQCPWCLADVYAGATHDEMCLPNNLWGPRDVGDARDLMFPLRPSAKSHRKMPGARGAGLKPLRERLVMTQEQFAKMCGINKNTFSRMERGDLTLTLRNAEKIAAAFGVTVESLYINAEPEQVQPPALPKADAKDLEDRGMLGVPPVPPAPPASAP